MFVPEVRQGSNVPRQLLPIVTGAIAVIVALLSWAILFPGSISTETQYATPRSAAADAIHSIAYIIPGKIPGASSDTVYVRRADSAASGSEREIASFGVAFNNLHAVGSASPTGNRIAILSSADAGSVYARMALISLPGGGTISPAGDFDFSRLAWSADGTRVAGTRTARAEDSDAAADVFNVDVIEVNAARGGDAVVAHMERVFSAVPVGYSVDGSRLFVAVVDQSGSSLWAVREGKAAKVAPLSAGPTRDWTLSPDGSRLAYIDILGAGERTYAGRTLLIATGAIVDAGGSQNQWGTAFQPGSQVPVFGGPGGSLQLDSDATLGGSYIVPASWSPDGSTLVATTYSASSDQATSPKEALEVFLPSKQRVLLSEENGVRLLGWVVD